MRRRRGAVLGLALSGALALAGCASGHGATLDAGRPAPLTPTVATGDPATVPSSGPAESSGPAASSTDPSASATGRAAPPASVPGVTPTRAATVRPRATVVARRVPAPVGNASGHAAVPAAARPVDTSRPSRVIGTGTPASCTSDAVVAAVAAGGVVTFDCGAAPVTITLARTAKVDNNHPELVLDGGGRVTLSGGGARRILYQNTCDQAQHWTSAHCDDQATPRLVVQNLTFANGNSSGDGEGGGAIFDRGGRLEVINSRFVGNRCAPAGPDLGGAAIRVLDQSQDRPVYVVGSTFTGGTCANGGGISSIGVSWVVLNSVFSGNTATGTGASSGNGGNGGAIYLDGNAMTLVVRGTRIEGNTAGAGGGAVFFVSNDRTGTMTVDASTLRNNVSKGFETPGLPGIFFLGARTPTLS